MVNSFFIKERTIEHLRKNVIYYIISCISIIVGVVVGIYLALTNYKYTSLLTATDNIMFDFINGTASYTEIFYSRLADMLLCLLIIFVFSLSVYSSIINYIFICYQTVLFVLSCGALVSLYGVIGIINVILFMIPINLLNILIMVIFNIYGIERANTCRSFSLNFFGSFKENGYLLKVLLCVLFVVVVCVLHSFILPLIIKSFIVVNY